MTTKVATIVLTYKLGLLSYGNLKLENEKSRKEDCLAVLKLGLWQTGFFRCSKERYHFQQELMVNKLVI